MLAVQAVLSLRLVWSTTAFQDEALYLRAGHLEWAHWLHQAPVPAFPAYFSGAPVLYPPLAAAADSLGGLAAARLLSLCLMLGVTGLLWATTARLYGRRAALLASGLFATLAGTQFLGAFATFDAMALFLLALAAWLAVRAAATAGFLSRAALLAAAGLALAAANAVTYPTVLFTPVVLAVAALAVVAGAAGPGLADRARHRGRLLARAGRGGRRGGRPRLLAGRHRQHAGPPARRRRGDDRTAQRVRLDQPDPRAGRARRGDGPGQPGGIPR